MFLQIFIRSVTNCLLLRQNQLEYAFNPEYIIAIWQKSSFR